MIKHGTIQMLEQLSAGYTTKQAYEFGYDCGKRGANMQNCDWRIFRTQAHTDEWGRGKVDGEKGVTTDG